MASQLTDSGLPQVKKKHGRPPKGQAFTELVEKIGGEISNYHGLPILKRELVIRRLYDLLLEGKTSFPDGREMTVTYDQWSKLAWDLIKHVEIVAVNVDMKQNGSLIGSSLNTQVILYLPDNERSKQIVYEFKDGDPRRDAIEDKEFDVDESIGELVDDD